MSSFDYYNTPSQHGNYQYVTLNELINDYMMSRDADDFTSNVPRYKVLYQAKRGLRELYYDVLKEIRAIELELSPMLSIVLPPDFVNYVRISWVGEDGQLHPLAQDSSMSMAQIYLQDNDFSILFDDEGCVLQADNHPAGSSTTLNADAGSEGSNSYDFCYGGFSPNKDASTVFPNGKFRLDPSSGLIQFSSDVQGKRIVLEYISDGLYTGCEGREEAEVRVHKFAEQALLDFIFHGLIKNRRNVPANEKQRARKEFFNSRRVTKRRISALRFSELKQVFKGDSVWVKK
jgi:hypothetical protein